MWQICLRKYIHIYTAYKRAREDFDGNALCVFGVELHFLKGCCCCDQPINRENEAITHLHCSTLIYTRQPSSISIYTAISHHPARVHIYTKLIVLTFSIMYHRTFVAFLYTTILHCNAVKLFIRKKNK